MLLDLMRDKRLFYSERARKHRGAFDTAATRAAESELTVKSSIFQVSADFLRIAGLREVGSPATGN